MERFRVIVEASSGICQIVPYGELDLATAPSLEEAWERAERTGARRLVLDLRQLTFMDAAGVTLLLRWAKRSRDMSLTLQIIGRQNGPIERLLALCGVYEALPWTDDPDSPNDDLPPT